MVSCRNYYLYQTTPADCSTERSVHQLWEEWLVTAWDGRNNGILLEIAATLPRLVIYVSSHVNVFLGALSTKSRVPSTSIICKRRNMSPAISPKLCDFTHPSSVTALSLLWGRRGFLLEPIPAVCGRGQSTPWTRALSDGGGRHARCQPHIRSNLGFSILLKATLTCR